MRKIELLIIGHKWTVRVLKKRSYKKRHGADSVGITDPDKRRIDLRGEKTSLETVIHEMVHAYMAELCMSSVEMDADQAEEVFAELMSRFGFELLNQSHDLWEKIQEGEKNEQP